MPKPMSRVSDVRPKQAVFAASIKQFPKRLVMITEGDSWFSYPLNSNIADYIEMMSDFSMLRLEHNGDDARDILGRNLFAGFHDRDRAEGTQRLLVLAECERESSKAHRQMGIFQIDLVRFGQGPECVDRSLALLEDIRHLDVNPCQAFQTPTALRVGRLFQNQQRFLVPIKPRICARQERCDIQIERR